jgi:hypothetical protein
MLYFKALLPIVAIIVPALASSLTERNNDDNCVSDRTAKDLVTTFQHFFTTINPAVANKTLTEDFQLFSDSQEFTTPGITPVSSNFKTMADLSKSRPSFAYIN